MCRITSIPSQVLLVQYNNLPFNITLDSGATVSYIKLDVATRLKLDIKPNSQLALLADQKTRMASLGEVNVVVYLQNIQLRLRALVMQHLQAECFGGTTFHVDNSIETNIKQGTLSIHGKFIVKQSNFQNRMPNFPPPTELSSLKLNESSHSLATTNEKNSPMKLNAISLPSSRVIYPYDHLAIPMPSSHSSGYVSITPSFKDALDNPRWSPQICEIINGFALYQNVSAAPLIAAKYSHFRPNPVEISDLDTTISEPSANLLSMKLNVKKSMEDYTELIALININEKIMSQDQINRLNLINRSFCDVFNSDLSKGYNHSAGQFYADFIFSNKPPPTRVYVPQYNKKCTDLQQAKCDELEVQGVLIDPKTHNIPVFHVSPSWIQQKGRAKHKPLQDCSLDELRFITAFNALNSYIRPKPTTSCSASTVLMFLARWKFHIFADLNNSYFQLPVKKKLWSYLGIMTPHKGVRVLTRTGQGLLGSDVELEELLCRVLGDDTTAGHCVAVRDDIIIGGNSIDEALDNFESVMSKLHACNLKLSPSKIRIFPNDTEIYGYRFKNGHILPSDHTVKSLGLAKIEDLKTNKHVNSWKGLYKVLIGHIPALSEVLSPFDAATAGKDSREKFQWTPALTAAFNAAMKHLNKINETFLPKPDEQLVLLPDAMSTSPCVGWVLYVKRNEKLLPVRYCTAKLKDYMVKWFPCEKEAMGAVLALNQSAHWIRESTLPTLVGPDNLSVVKAVDLIRKGRHSSNPRLQSLLASVNRLNVIFFHNSAKAGKHVVPDYLSRLKSKTCGSKDCAVERFLEDIPVNIEAMSIQQAQDPTTLLALALEESVPAPAIIGATATELGDRLLASGPIPLGSRTTWIQMQKSDPDCQTVFKLKTLGEEPRKKDTNPYINRIFKDAIIHRGLIVVRSLDHRKLREIDRVVVPPSYLHSILSVLHLKLNHPKQTQLKAVFDRYFYSPRIDGAITELYNSCYLCLSLKKFPRELELFSPSLFPEHPGCTMNADVVKRAGQLILVNVDMFSSYVTGCFVESEKSEDLASALIQVVTPIRRSGSVLIRVDQAPGFVKLANSKQSLLSEVGILLELAHDENKNSNCVVDKIINELEAEFRKISPSGDRLNQAQLAQSLMTLNEKVRKRGLSSAEIHFSRDSHDHENLPLNDKLLQQEQKNLRLKNHDYLAKSRNPKGTRQSLPSFNPGDIVFTKSAGSKHVSRDPHIIVHSKPSGNVLVRKTLHSSPFASSPMNMSTHVKSVDRKFLFKPKNQPVSNADMLGNPNFATKSPFVSSYQPSTKPWDPVMNDDENYTPLPIQETENNQDLLSDNEDQLEHNQDRPPSSLDTDENYQQSIESYERESLSSSASSSHRHISSYSSEQEQSDDNPKVVTFNPGQGDDLPEQLLQDRKPRPGDLISFFDERTQVWLDARITKDLSNKWRHYFNIVYNDGGEDGLYLIPNTRWTFRDSHYAAGVEVNRSPDRFLSLKPTPETTPEQLTLTISDTSSVDILNKSLESLEWDMMGTQLESSQSSFLECHEFDLPDLPLNQVCRLDNNLPLTSTWKTSQHPPVLLPATGSKSKNRVALPRRPLPEENPEIRGFLPRFAQRLNPFKKKKETPNL